MTVGENIRRICQERGLTPVFDSSIGKKSL